MINMQLSQSKILWLSTVGGNLFFSWLAEISYSTEQFYIANHYNDYTVFLPQSSDYQTFCARFGVELYVTVTHDSQHNIDTVTLHVQ